MTSFKSSAGRQKYGTWQKGKREKGKEAWLEDGEKEIIITKLYGNEAKGQNVEGMCNDPHLQICCPPSHLLVPSIHVLQVHLVVRHELVVKHTGGVVTCSTEKLVQTGTRTVVH